MRVICELIDRVEYFEVILTPKEFRKAESKGCVAEFTVEDEGYEHIINVFIRKEDDPEILEEEEEDYAFKKREKQEGNFREYPRDGGSGAPPKAGRRSRLNNGSKIRSAYL